MGLLPEECRYNENPCGRCPDCVTYGYAIGDSGAEKSKVYSDTAYSLSDHAISHEVRTFNAPGETGTMYDQATGNTSNRINSTEYIKPGVIFPSILTSRDLTFPLFCYVLNNHLSTQRYGATTTRTGRMENNIIGIVIGQGEIMSNLALTQAIYDDLKANQLWDDTGLNTIDQVRASAERTLEGLLRDANVPIQAAIGGDDLTELLTEFRTSIGQNPKERFDQAIAHADDYKARLRPAAKSGGRGGKKA
jgi:CRISPR-associated protein Csc2